MPTSGFSRWMLALAFLLPPGLASAQTLGNEAFRIEYDAGGIRSLKRANDAHDTNYIASGGHLGPVVVRYRSTPQGDWREVREVMSLDRSADGRSISYEFGTLLPTLAAKSTPSAQVGAGSLRALNDGRVPASAASGRGGATAGGTGGGGRAGAQPVPVFTWQGSRGDRQWVQLTFPVVEEVSRAQVFWAAGRETGTNLTLPDSWRLLYRDGQEWKDVQATSPLGKEANAFTTVEFVPVRTTAMRIEVALARDATCGVAEWRIGPERVVAPLPDLQVRQSFTLDGDILDWTLTLANQGRRPIEIGDLAVPFAFAERTPPRTEIYTNKLLRHSLIAGHGSWIYWQRAGGEGPLLVMTPMGSTKFEYFDNSGGGLPAPGAFTPYVHAKVAHAAALGAGGNWRLPITNLVLAPEGKDGGQITYSFRFQWAGDPAGVRDVLFKEQKFDTVVVPGMAIPADLPATIALRTKNEIRSVQPEHPAATSVQFLGEKREGIKLYRVRFSRLGENMLTVRYGDGRWASLEFFVTEPLETLIRKRAAFLANRQQHKDPGKWYYGAYGDWDQKNQILRNPEDRDGLSTWLTDANDDAGNARPAYLASKNVFYPDKREIESLEIYIGRYLWGGMQMTEKEKYPYGIYGIPNFRVNRESADPGRNGQAHLWRIYDYPHIILLYYRMYQIAKFYPDMIAMLDADQYLERAYRTAVAYWTVPNEIEKWSADAVGTMNEAFIPELIQTLEEAGKKEWAGTLRRFWEGKIDRFVNRTPNLYGSEFAFDSTGFESTGAMAKYAMAHVAKPGESAATAPAGDEFSRRVTYDAALKFTNFQLLLDMIDRGWLETTYYQLGSDYRGSLSYLLSYMSQMGGWSILDYGLHMAKDPTDHLRLGYASSLSSWALVNSGTAESGYGYWFPAPENDGATGGGFVPEAMGRGWIGKQMPRGAWHYSAEEDVGYCGALRTHATILTVDPIFGEMAYGGLFIRKGRTAEVVPRDGLRVRFHVIRGSERLHMVLDRDGYAKERPIAIDDGLGRIAFTLENRARRAHETRLTISGLPAGAYSVTVAGRQVATIRGGTATEEHVALPVGTAPSVEVIVRRM